MDGAGRINGVLYVGKGYRQAWMHLADRLRTDREQWYPGDSESGENGIWGDARPGSFDPSKVYRVPVSKKDSERRNLYVTFAAGYRKARPEDCWRTDRQEVVFTDDFGAFKWIEATPGENNPSAIYQVPVERKDEPGVFGDSRGEAGAPPVVEFENGGRPGGPDCQNDEIDDDPEYLTAADFLRDDAVDHPNHYNDGSIECIDAIQAALTEEEFIGFCKGNALKYIWREQWKNGMEDLQKAAWYLNRATEGLEAAE